MTQERDDGVWEVALTPLGTSSSPVGVVEIRVSASLRRWADDAVSGGRRTTWGEWRSLGEGRYAIEVHLGAVEVDAVIERDGDTYAGRAVARARDRGAGDAPGD